MQNVKIVIIIQLILIDKSNRNAKSNIKFFISISTALKISYHRLIFLERITSIPVSIRDQIKLRIGKNSIPRTLFYREQKQSRQFCSSVHRQTLTKLVNERQPGYIMAMYIR